MLTYKTEDEVRDEARILLNLTNNEDKTKSGVGQLAVLIIIISKEFLKDLTAGIFLTTYRKQLLF